MSKQQSNIYKDLPLRVTGVSPFVISAVGGVVFSIILLAVSIFFVYRCFFKEDKANVYQQTGQEVITPPGTRERLFWFDANDPDKKTMWKSAFEDIMRSNDERACSFEVLHAVFSMPPKPKIFDPRVNEDLFADKARFLAAMERRSYLNGVFGIYSGGMHLASWANNHQQSTNLYFDPNGHGQSYMKKDLAPSSCVASGVPF